VDVEADNTFGYVHGGWGCNLDCYVVSNQFLLTLETIC
jgi:hypothetical protein